MNGKVLERYAELMIDKIRQMSAGEWQKPWFTPRAGLPQNISGRPYNSMNRLMLYMEMDRMGYTLPVFMTFRQLKDENLMVIKGSHALPVTFYDITVKHKTTGEKISFDDYKSLPELQKQEYKVTPFMKHFYVFNIDQTDFKEKYPERYEDMRVRFSGPAVADNVKGNGNPRLDKMIKEQKWLCPIELKVQDRAYYSPSKDRIVLPAFSICMTARKNNIRMQWPSSVWGMNTRHIIRMRKDSMRYLAYAQGKRCREKTARRS